MTIGCGTIIAPVRAQTNIKLGVAGVQSGLAVQCRMAKPYA